MPENAPLAVDASWQVVVAAEVANRAADGGHLRQDEAASRRATRRV